MVDNTRAFADIVKVGNVIKTNYSVPGDIIYAKEIRAIVDDTIVVYRIQSYVGDLRYGVDSLYELKMLYAQGGIELVNV